MTRELLSAPPASELARILEGTSGAFAALDGNDRFTYLNQSAEAFLGRSRQELLGKDACVECSLEPRQVALIRRATEEDRPGQFEIFAPMSNRWLTWEISAGSDGVWILMRDTTHQRRAEEELRRYAAIVESSEDAILSKDLNGIITSWNAGAVRLFGYSADEVIGQPITILMPPGHRNDMVEILGRIRRGERIEHFETVRVTKDGREIPVSLSVSPVKNASGTIVGAAKIARDITEIRRREAERDRLFQEAENAVKIRDAFLSIAGHELRTPLGALVLNLQAWELRARRENDQRSLTRLGTLRRLADRLSRLTDDLLDVSRIESGKLQLEREPTDLAAVVREVVERLEASAFEQGTSFELDLASVVGWWDRSRIDQVITNLLTNAVKFGHGQPVAIRVAAGDGKADLTVTDQGIGIAPEHQSRIFERFERAVSEKSYSGMGLGLWITRELVRAHDGRIGVESEPGKGATFRVLLPLPTEKPAPPVP